MIFETLLTLDLTLEQIADLSLAALIRGEWTSLYMYERVQFFLLHWVQLAGSPTLAASVQVGH